MQPWQQQMQQQQMFQQQQQQMFRQQQQQQQMFQQQQQQQRMFQQQQQQQQQQLQQQLQRDQQMRDQANQQLQQSLERDRRMREDAHRRSEAHRRHMHAVHATGGGGGGGFAAGGASGAGGGSTFVSTGGGGSGGGGGGRGGPPPGVHQVRLPDGSVVTRQGPKLIVLSGTGGYADMPFPTGWCPRSELLARQEEMGEEAYQAECFGTLRMLAPSKGKFTGAKWNDRFLVHSGFDFSYYKTVGDARDGQRALGSFSLQPGCSIEPVESDSPRRKDAFKISQQNPSIAKLLTNPIQATMSPYDGVVGVDHAFALHIPAQANKQIDGLLGAVGGGSVFTMASRMKAAREANRARTYYFACDTPEERDAWVEVIRHNERMYEVSGAGREDAVADLAGMLSRVGVLGVDEMDLFTVMDTLWDGGQDIAAVDASLFGDDVEGGEGGAGEGGAGEGGAGGGAGEGGAGEGGAGEGGEADGEAAAEAGDGNEEAPDE